MAVTSRIQYTSINSKILWWRHGHQPASPASFSWSSSCGDVQRQTRQEGTTPEECFLLQPLAVSGNGNQEERQHQGSLLKLFPSKMWKSWLFEKAGFRGFIAIVSGSYRDKPDPGYLPLKQQTDAVWTGNKQSQTSWHISGSWSSLERCPEGKNKLT